MKCSKHIFLVRLVQAFCHVHWPYRLSCKFWHTMLFSSLLLCYTSVMVNVSGKIKRKKTRSTSFLWLSFLTAGTPETRQCARAKSRTGVYLPLAGLLPPRRHNQVSDVLQSDVCLPKSWHSPSSLKREKQKWGEISSGCLLVSLPELNEMLTEAPQLLPQTSWSPIIASRIDRQESTLGLTTEKTGCLWNSLALMIAPILRFVQLVVASPQPQFSPKQTTRASTIYIFIHFVPLTTALIQYWCWILVW